MFSQVQLIARSYRGYTSILSMRNLDWDKFLLVRCIHSWDNRDLQIGLRVRDWVRVRLLNSSFQASHYHNTNLFHPMSYSLYLKPIWRTRALERSLVWNSKILLVLNLVLVVQFEHFPKMSEDHRRRPEDIWMIHQRIKVQFKRQTWYQWNHWYLF